MSRLRRASSYGQRAKYLIVSETEQSSHIRIEAVAELVGAGSGRAVRGRQCASRGGGQSRGASLLCEPPTHTALPAVGGRTCARRQTERHRGPSLLIRKGHQMSAFMRISSDSVAGMKTDG